MWTAQSFVVLMIFTLLFVSEIQGQGCLDDEFECNNEQCIPAAWECDRLEDCSDTSDEHVECVGCSDCTEDDRCDGDNEIYDCPDMTDEIDCGGGSCRQNFAVEVTATSITITWSSGIGECFPDTTGVNLEAFITNLDGCPIAESTKVSEMVFHYTDTDEGDFFFWTETVVVDNLRPHSTYDVKITGIVYEVGRFVEPCLPLPFVTTTKTTLESDPSTGPTNLMATSTSPHSLQLSWEPAVCGNRNRDLTHYDYEYSYYATGFEDEKVSVTSTTTTATINGLPCNTEFYFEVFHSTIFDEERVGPPSSIRVWTTTTAPTGIVGSQAATEVSFTWEQPSCVSSEGNSIQVYQYVLCPTEFALVDGECIISEGNRKRRQATPMTGQTSTNSLTITDLSCNTQYNFILTALNGDGGTGDSSDPISISTDVSAPGSVSGQIMATSVSVGIELSWSPPSTACTSAATNYLVEYALIHLDNCMDIPVPSRISYGVVSETTVTVTDLTPHSTYVLYVTPVNSGGSGPARSTSWHTSRAAVPPVSPMGLNNTARTSTSLTFTWDPIPCGTQYGSINSYTYRLSLGSTGELLREYTFYRPDSPFTTVYDLLPNVQYGFQIAADIVYGDDITGPFSVIVLATTSSNIINVSMDSGTTSMPALPASRIDIEQTSYSVDEDAGFVSIILRRTPGTLSSPDIVVKTLSDSALPEEDYIPVITVVRFAPSSSEEETKLMTITIISDVQYEGDEYFFVQISGSAVTEESMSALVAIIDDDQEPTEAAFLPLPPSQAPTQFTFDRQFYFVSETGNGILPCKVIRNGNNMASVTLRVKTESTSAFSPQDYIDLDETVEFVTGQIYASLRVQINYDTIMEGQETFVLRLWSGTSLLDQSQITITEGDVNLNKTAQVSCPRETFSSPHGDINVASAIVGAVQESKIVCPITSSNAGVPVTTATCVLGVRGATAYWDWQVNCGSEQGTDQALRQLVSGTITNDNALEIISTVEELTNTNDIGTSGITHTAQIVEQVVALALPDPEITTDIVKTVDNLMGINEEMLLESNTIDRSPSRTVAAMEEQLQHVELSTYDFFRQVEQNVAVEVMVASADDFQSGLGVASYDRPGTRRTNLKIMYGHNLPSEELPEVAMFLPQDISDMDIFNSDTALRVTFTVLSIDAILPSQPLADNNKELKDNGFQRAVNSRVISAIVGSREELQLSQPVMAMYRPVNPRANNTECVFWDFPLNDWSPNGCRNVGVVRGLQQCECDHLTNFAVLMDIYGQTTLTKTQDYILEILSYVGCCMSILGLTITLVTYGTSKKLRSRKPNKILMNLCGALVGLYVVFIAMISVDTDRGKSEVSGIACGILAGLLQYFTLASLFWMAVEAFNMYLLFVRVVNSYVSSLLTKASLVGWGLPGIIVVATGAVSRSSYTRSDFCFLQTLPLVGGVLAPIGMLMIFNVVVFVLVMRSLSKVSPATSKLQLMQRKKRSRRVRNAVAILLLLGLTWAVGFLGLIRAATFITQLMFCVLNSMQGYLIFMMYCVQQPEVRNHWRQLFGLKDKMRRMHPHSRTPPMKSSDVHSSKSN